MKTYNKFYLILFLIGVSFLFQNCKKEDIPTQDENQITEILFLKQGLENDKVMVNHFDELSGELTLKMAKMDSIAIFEKEGNIMVYNDNYESVLQKETNKSLKNKLENEETYVPDDNFEQALIELGFDELPLDDYVLTKNISSIKKLSISSKNINDLTGIEGFKALEFLICDSNYLKILNLNQNLALTHVCCIGNKLTSIDISKNMNLLYLYCKCNLLENLDVGNNINLVHLDCNDNNLNELDVSKNTALKCLFCNRNKLTNLDIGNNTKLTHLKTNYNLGLTCIKVSQSQLINLPCGWYEDEYTDYKTVCN